MTIFADTDAATNFIVAMTALVTALTGFVTGIIAGWRGYSSLRAGQKRAAVESSEAKTTAREAVDTAVATAKDHGEKILNTNAKVDKLGAEMNGMKDQLIKKEKDISYGQGVQDEKQAVADAQKETHP